MKQEIEPTAAELAEIEKENDLFDDFDLGSIEDENFSIDGKDLFLEEMRFGGIQKENFLEEDLDEWLETQIH